MNLQKFPHSAMFVGVTACGKTEFLLRLLETIYKNHFEDRLRENDVIPDKNERDRLKKYLQDRPYSKLILKCCQPTGYYLL